MWATVGAARCSAAARGCCHLALYAGSCAVCLIWGVAFTHARFYGALAGLGLGALLELLLRRARRFILWGVTPASAEYSCRGSIDRDVGMSMFESHVHVSKKEWFAAPPGSKELVWIQLV